MSGTASGDTLSVTECQVSATPAYETMPRLGNDGSTDLVVYTSRVMLADGAFGRGEIFFQRLAAGAPSGAPVQVTSDPTDDELNDVSGDFIVYTAYDDTTTLSGRIMLYQISTGLLFTIGSAPIIQEPRINGSKVVWRQGGGSSAQVMLYDLAWWGTTREADIIAGPVPPTFFTHSTFLPLTVPVTAMWVIAVEGEAACQCFTPGGRFKRSTHRQPEHPMLGRMIACPSRRCG